MRINEKLIFAALILVGVFFLAQTLFGQSPLMPLYPRKDSVVGVWKDEFHAYEFTKEGDVYELLPDGKRFISRWRQEDKHLTFSLNDTNAGKWDYGRIESPNKMENFGQRFNDRLVRVR